MFSFNDKISVRQLQTLLLLETFGTGVLVLPRLAAGYAGQDGWLSIIAATFVAAVCAFLIASVGRLFPSESFVGYTSKLLSRPVAVVIALVFVFRLIVTVAMELRSFGEIMKLTMLHDTPFGVYCAAMLAVGGYAASKGCESLGRTAQILVLAFVPLTAVFIIGCADVDFSNLMPVLAASPQDILLGGLYSARAFTGIELTLLIYPFIARPKGVRRGVIQVVFVIGGFLLFITLVCIAKFGPFDIMRQLWPALEMMDAIDLPGSFIERQDAFIMSFWIISVFVITDAGLFFAALLLNDIFGRLRHSVYIAICAIIVFLTAFMPESISEVYWVLDAMLPFTAVYMFVLPLLLLTVARLRGYRGESVAAEQVSRTPEETS